jgi:hypothetical protein
MNQKELTTFLEGLHSITGRTYSPDLDSNFRASIVYTRPYEVEKVKGLCALLSIPEVFVFGTHDPSKLDCVILGGSLLD